MGSILTFACVDWAERMLAGTSSVGAKVNEAIPNGALISVQILSMGTTRAARWQAQEWSKQQQVELWQCRCPNRFCEAFAVGVHVKEIP